MAYNIRYGADAVKYEIMERNTAYNNLTVAFITAACAVAMGIFLLRTPQVRDYLMPGDKAVTKAALTEMVQDIRHGENITEALTAFCKEIISHAEAS